MTFNPGRVPTFSFKDFIKAGRDLQNPAIKREQTIKQQGSPDYTYFPGAINATTHSAIEIIKQFPDAAKYAPLDRVLITNNDGNDLTITINGEIQKYVPAGTVINIKDRPIWSIDVYNMGAAATTANKIALSFSRQPYSADQAARGL